MIQKIKELMALNDEIEIIKNNLKYATNSVNGLKDDINSMKQTIDNSANNITDRNDEYFKNFHENLDVIKNIRHEFEKELFQFQLMKSQMQKTIIQKFEEELGKELKVQMENLKNDGREYNDMKQSVKDITAQVSNLSEEIGKLILIRRNIKKEDFELTKFANQLLELDKEKLELMRKIDTLERLVSKIRRQEFITR